MTAVQYRANPGCTLHSALCKAARIQALLYFIDHWLVLKTWPQRVPYTGMNRSCRLRKVMLYQLSSDCSILGLFTHLKYTSFYPFISSFQIRFEIEKLRNIYIHKPYRSPSTRQTSLLHPTNCLCFSRNKYIFTFEGVSINAPKAQPTCSENFYSESFIYETLLYYGFHISFHLFPSIQLQKQLRQKNKRNITDDVCKLRWSPANIPNTPTVHKRKTLINWCVYLSKLNSRPIKLRVQQKGLPVVDCPRSLEPPNCILSWLPLQNCCLHTFASTNVPLHFWSG